MPVRKWCAGVAVLVLMVSLSGCSGFFPPINNSGGSGGDSSLAGDFVYIANSASNNMNVAAYAVGTDSTGAGTLTAVSGSPFALPSVPTAMAITPNNSYLFVACNGGILGFSVNTTSGALSALNGGSIEAITTFGSASLDVSPDGQWLFALSQDNGTLSEYQIGSNGSLTLASSIPYGVANGTTSAARMVKVAPNGAYVILAIGTGGGWVFPFNTSTGAVNTTSGVPFGTNSSSTGVNAIAVNSSYLFVAQSGTAVGIAVYQIGTNGALTAVKGSPFASGNGPSWFSFDKTGKYLYAANRADGTISGYVIGTGGVLTPLNQSPYASGSAVDSLAFDNSGDYMLASAGGGSPDLTMYSFDATNAGALDKATSTATGTDPTAAVMVVTTH